MDWTLWYPVIIENFLLIIINKYSEESGNIQEKSSWWVDFNLATQKQFISVSDLAIFIPIAEVEIEYSIDLRKI